MKSARYMSYLDLMCCGFGGALLMFLIVAAARPEQSTIDQLLVVRCHAPTGGSAAPLRAEVGIEFRAQGDPRWIRVPPNPAEPQVWSFAVPSTGGSGSESLLIWRHPPKGIWEFRPYLRDLPAPTTVAVPANDVPATPSVDVVLEVLGRHVETTGEAKSSLELPGDSGNTLSVNVLTR